MMRTRIYLLMLMNFYSSNFQVFLTLINIMIIVNQYLLSSGIQELLFIFEVVVLNYPIGKI